MSKKALVTYFSCTGYTQKAAGFIKDLTGADMAEIVPKQAYSTADLDYMNPKSRVSKEHADASSRPELAEKLDVAPYEVVFVGYPIWWSEAPNIILTFLEANAEALAGKIVVPFCTAHSTGLEESDVHLHKYVSAKAQWKGGRDFTMNPQKNAVADWIKSLEI